MKRHLLVLLTLGQLACSGAHATGAPPRSAPPPAPSEWLSALDRDHALVGKIWDQRAGRFVELPALLERARSARYVLLGERHDNPDHHRLQARVLAGLVERGRHPAVVLEMLDIEQQAAVDAYLTTPQATPAATAAGLGEAVKWQDSGWPPFAEYQPLFEAALAAKLPLAAGNITHESARALVKRGISALPAERAQQLWLDQPFPEPLAAALAEELRLSHCGHLPESLIAPMALAQHARDAQMARTLTDPRFSDGAVLIAGAGHARLDRGVPYYLKLAQPDAPVLSIAFREVAHGVTDPRDAESAAHDFVWFTPRLSDEDPCAAFTKPK